MKCYVAGGFEKKNSVQAVQQELRNRGHVITLDWTLHQKIPSYQDNLEIARDYTEEDINGVLGADVYILLTEGAGKGAHVELGAAIATRRLTGKPKIYVVGEQNDSQMFYFHRFVSRKRSIEDVLSEL